MTNVQQLDRKKVSLYVRLGKTLNVIAAWPFFIKKILSHN